MGQTYSTGAAQDTAVRLGPIEVPELADIAYEKTIGTSRFLKTVRGRQLHSGGAVVIKVFQKPLANFPLDHYRRQVYREQDALESVPNAFTYQRVVETDRAAYLVRQHLYSSLYDRISTRPFLELIEKRWIAYQLLCGVRDCHARDIHHGDIKSENVLVTSWNWIYLADFAPFKPTYLPADNPADFSYFFDTSLRRVCYIAPERFVEASQRNADGKITDAMDIFSLGCVIAELFLEGTPLFTLSQLFKYRSGEYDPAAHLAKIDDPEIRRLVQHMINIDPAQRSSAEKYLQEFRRKAFPEYFYSFLHQYLNFVTDPTSGGGQTLLEDELYGRADDRIDRIYHDFDKISFFLGYEQSDSTEKREPSKDSTIPVHMDVPNYRRKSPTVRRTTVTVDDGTLIFLTLVSSSIRSTSRATSRVRACDLILAFAERITDEAKLDRCLPYLVALLGDESVAVKVAVIRTLTQLMELVETAAPINCHVFPNYILPKIMQFSVNKNTLVRATFASCLASLAKSAARFLDMTQASRADGALPIQDPEAEDSGDPETTMHLLFDAARADLIGWFQDQSKTLLTDQNSAVRRSYLKSVATLCVFFGRAKANDTILSHLNTYLNDKDWMLRCAFFDTITGIATYLGGVALEEYIMPLMVQSLTDPEEFVVEKVLKALATMAELGLFQRSKTWELVDVVGRFMIHPNIWIREGAVGFISSSTKWLAPADTQCIIYPLVKPFLEAHIVEFSTLNLLENLKKPISRNVLETTVTWAMQARDSPFWRAAQQQKTFIFGSGAEPIPRLTAGDVHPEGGARISKNHEDEQWLGKLRNLGLAPEDEWKIVALREYVYRMSRSKPRLLSESVSSLLAGTISLKNLEITPKTIFFNENESFFNMQMSTSASSSIQQRPGTIAEALIEASKAADRAQVKGSQRSLRRVASDIRRSKRSIGSANGSGTTTPTLPHAQSETDLTRLTVNTIAIPRLSVSGATASNSSSPTSSIGSGLRTKPSKSNLMNRDMGPSKASAETSTVPATAFGEVEPPFGKDHTKIAAKMIAETQQEQPVYNFRSAHTYDGNDPHLLKLLDSMYLQNYPSDIVEFGPAIVPLARRQPIKKSTGKPPVGPWRPEGSLVASFGEHTASVNRVVVAPDHNFFITASNDGTVKIWDSNRLEKNVSFKSRQTHRHGNNVKVKAICFIENTRCFVSAASDGSIHVVKVDFNPATLKYGRLKTIREWQLPENESAVWVEHFKADSNSILLIATNACNVHALDLRTMTILYTLRNPVHHGTPICFCMDNKHNWLILGTSHGILDMWDLRFQLRVKAWGLSGHIPIHRLQVHPTKGRGKYILVAGGTGHGEISTWDIEKLQCREVYRSSTTPPAPRAYEPWNVDDESSEKMLAKFANAEAVETTSASASSPSPIVDRGIRAFVCDVDVVEDPKTGNTTFPGFLLAAGTDRKVRFWNCAKIESSMVVSGMEYDEPKPLFASSHPLPTLVVNAEKPEPVNKPESSTAAAKKKSAANTSRTPRSTVITQQQQMLMRNHLDMVMDVAFLEVPYGMVVSVDRSGMVFINQ